VWKIFALKNKKKAKKTARKDKSQKKGTINPSLRTGSHPIPKHFVSKDTNRNDANIAQITVVVILVFFSKKNFPIIAYYFYYFPKHTLMPVIWKNYPQILNPALCII